MKTSSIVRISTHPRLYRWLGFWIIALLMVGLVFSTQPALNAHAAVQAICTSTASGDWSAAIWSCPSGPGSADDVIIAHDVDLSTNRAAHSLSVLADSSLAFRAPVTLTLSGDMSVDADGIFDPGNDMDATGGTVVFSGVNQSINTHGKWIDFYNLTKNTAGASKLSISTALNAEDGIHVLNHAILKGNGAVSLLSLKSGAPGTQWQILVDKSMDIDLVDVQDSKNVSTFVSNQPITVARGKNSGANTGWTFTSLVTTIQFYLPSISK